MLHEDFFCSLRMISRITRIARSTFLAIPALVASMAGQLTIARADSIDNGTVQLGINPEGNLISGGVGLTFLPTSGEVLAPGCACEGWGVADFGTALFGKAGESFGDANLGPGTLVVSGTGTAPGSVGSSATATVDVLSGAVAAINVKHEFAPSASPNLYTVAVTLTNVQPTAVGDMRYRRAMDWDVPPTTFSEYVTIQGWPASRLVASSDDGFADGNPNTPLSTISSTAVLNGNFVDSGPADHGAVFDFSFGSVAAGSAVGFKIYYGAAASEADAMAALAAVGAEVYSLGQPSSPGGPDLGIPNTFIFGFSGVGGTPVTTRGAEIDFLNAFRDLAFTAGANNIRHLGLRFDGQLGGGERYAPTVISTSGSEINSGAVESIEAFDGSTPLSFEGNGLFNIAGLRGFVTGSSSFGDRDRSGDQAGYNFRSTEVSLGAEYEIYRGQGFFHSVIVGGAYGLTRSDADIANSESEVKLKANTGTAYIGANFLGRGYADASVSFTSLDFDYYRKTVNDFEYAASPNGDMVSGHFRVGYDIPLTSLAALSNTTASIGPYVRLDFASVDIDDFAEVGRSPGLAVESQDAESLRLETGLRGAVWFRTAGALFGFHGKAGYLHDFRNDGDVVSQFTAGGLQLDANLLAPEKGALAVAAGLSAKATEALIIRLDYEATLFNSDREEHSFIGRVRAAF